LIKLLALYKEGSYTDYHGSFCLTFTQVRHILDRAARSFLFSISPLNASLTELGTVTTMSNNHGYMSNIVGGYSVIGKIVVVGGYFTPTSNIPMETAIGGRFPVPIANVTPIRIFDASSGTYIDSTINSNGDLVNLKGALTSGHNVFVSGAYLTN